MAECREQAQYLREGVELSRRQQLRMVVQLSIPAILAQLSTTVMQYIDAAMVGSLGAGASASIGLVSSTIWLMNGLCIAAVMGFSVQVAQLSGAGDRRKGQAVFCQSILIGAGLGLILALTGVGISPWLPRWLGGEPEILEDASRYLFIYACAMPSLQFRQLAGGMLQCSGDIKTPSILNIAMCALDVIFNSLLIFPTRQVSAAGRLLTLPGAGLGVTGAALGTALADVFVACAMMWAACRRSEFLRLDRSCRWRFDPLCWRTALRISLPLAMERAILSSAQIASTRIVAPLGTVAIAANTLGVTAESLCYLPGNGIGTAATTLVGQSLGAGRRDMARRFARLSVGLGAVVMSAAGMLLFLLSPAIFSLLTPDPEVQLLGAQVLRIEAFAEPLFAAAIVTAGALRGAGDTKLPSIMNLVSMWGISIPAAALLAPRLGLYGVWIAMCGELCIRGTLFLIRLFRERWLDHALVAEGRP